MSKKDVFNTSNEQLNWLLHLHFVRKDYNKCRSLLKDKKSSSHQSEYGCYVRGLISRIDGDINDSLKHFQMASAINSKNVANFKQVARSLFLLARHKAALDVYTEAQKLCPSDWEIAHNKGICYMYLKDLTKFSYIAYIIYLKIFDPPAKESLKEAISFKPSELSYSLLGKIYLAESNFNKAIVSFTKALEISPENVEISSTLGLLYLQMGDHQHAFSHLGNSMTFDPSNVKAIMGTGSMLQMHGDSDVALSKYKLAIRQTPTSGPLWNNVAMCFFNKKKFVAAVSCLKRAHYFSPFERTISQNLALLYMHTQQYASAFNFMASAMYLRYKSAVQYALLAVILAQLKDKENARQAFDQALQLDSKDALISLNYSIFLHNNDEIPKSFEQYRAYKLKLQHKNYEDDPEIYETSEKLNTALQVGNV